MVKNVILIAMSLIYQVHYTCYNIVDLLKGADLSE